MAGRTEPEFIGVQVPPELKAQIEAIGERDERSVSWVVRRALRDYVQQHGHDGEREAA